MLICLFCKQTLRFFIILSIFSCFFLSFLKIIEGRGYENGDDGNNNDNYNNDGNVYIDDSRPFLYIGILSAPKNFDRRNAIRQTWLSEIDTLPIKYKFYVGRLEEDIKIHDQILKEKNEFKDIHLMDMFDTYRSIHWKTRQLIKDGFDYEAAFVIKTDDDSFIRIFELFEKLLKLNYKRALYIGLMIHNQLLVDRDSKSPFYLSPSQLPEKYYPIFAYGSGYCMSRRLIKMFMREIEKLPIIPAEDVGTAQWVKLVKEKESVEYVHWDNIDFFGNNCKPDTLITHRTDPKRMTCQWNLYIKGIKNWCCQ